MTYEEVLAYLKDSDMTMSRYDRDHWDRFVDKAGLSIDFPYIHITGSNGKGSTANYLAGIYEAAGYKVALFSKPYVHAVNEMMKVGGIEITNEDFARIFETKKNLIEKCGLSAFEIETYIAFTFFNEMKPDIAIIEAGMGGALDATNLYDSKPLLSIITSVSLEHTGFLGRSEGEIALSKSGIIKNFSPVLIGKLSEISEEVIRKEASLHKSDFYLVDDYHHENFDGKLFTFSYRPFKDLAINSPSKTLLSDASLAVEATKILQTSLPIDEASLRKGLLVPSLPCRFEIIGNTILDGAHNPEAIESMMSDLSLISQGRTIHALFASYRDKNIAVMLPRIGRDVADITLTSFPSSRARNDEDYFLYLGDFEYIEDYREAYEKLSSSFPEDLILITGSLAFAYLMKDYILGKMK